MGDVKEEEERRRGRERWRKRKSMSVKEKEKDAQCRDERKFMGSVDESGREAARTNTFLRPSTSDALSPLSINLIRYSDARLS